MTGLEIKLQHIITFVGIVISSLLTIGIFIVGMLRSDIIALSKKMDEIIANYVSNNECKDRRKIVCNKIEGIIQDFDAHTHDEDGSVLIDKSCHKKLDK